MLQAASRNAGQLVSGARALCSSTSGVTVHILDARALFQAQDVMAAIQQHGMSVPVVSDVTSRLAEDPGKAVTHSLGTGEDPGNSWNLGKEGELFEYDMVGSVATTSGFVSLVLSGTDLPPPSTTFHTWEEAEPELKALKARRDGGRCLLQVSNPSWQGVQVPFIGQVVFAAGVDVYALRRSKAQAAEGIMLHGSETM